MNYHQVTEAIQYQLDLDFCNCDSTSPIGSCTHCDLQQILSFVQDQHSAVKGLTEIVDELLPQMGTMILQDYSKLNDTLITARKTL